VPVIDGGMFHNYVHVCKQLFLCDVIKSHYSPSTPLLQVSHLCRRERKETTDKKKDHGTVDEPSSE